MISVFVRIRIRVLRRPLSHHFYRPPSFPYRSRQLWLRQTLQRKYLFRPKTIDVRFTNIFVDGCFQQAILFISQVVIVFLGCLVPFFSLCFPFLASILVNDLSSAYSTSRTYHITHSFVLHHHRLLLFVPLCRYILSCAIFLQPLSFIVFLSHLI